VHEVRGKQWLGSGIEGLDSGRT